MEIPRHLLAAPVSTAAKLVLTALWSYAVAGKEPVAYPSAVTLGRVVGLHERQVRRHLEALVETHLITREKREVDGARKRVWVLNPDTSARTGHVESGPDTSARVTRTDPPGGRGSPDRTHPPKEPDASARNDRTQTSAEHTNEHAKSTPPPGTEGFALTAPEPRRASPKAQISALFRWWEGELHARGYRRQPQGLSDARRRGIEKVLAHIRQTLDTDLAGAIESQREHLTWRLEQCANDSQTRSRIGSETAWRQGWWDFWNNRRQSTPATRDHRRREWTREEDPVPQHDPKAKETAGAWLQSLTGGDS